MADISQIKLPNNTTYDLKDSKKTGIYYVKGTQTATTGAWTGNIDVPALYTGLTIMYYLPYDGSGNASLNLTLSNGTTTGAKNCYINTGRLTTHYGAGRNIIMTFYKAGDISIKGTATTDDRWICDAFYDTNDTSTLHQYYSHPIAGSNGMKQYSLFAFIDNNKISSFTTNNGTGTKTFNTTDYFDIRKIYYFNNGNNVAAGTAIGNNQISVCENLVDMRYTFNGVTTDASTSSLESNKPLYLVFEKSEINATRYRLKSPYFTQTPDDQNAIYVLVGYMYDSYRCNLLTHNFSYRYNGPDLFLPYSVANWSLASKYVNGHTVEINVPSDAVFTDTTYTFTNGGTNKFTVTPSGGTAQDVTFTASDSTKLPLAGGTMTGTINLASKGLKTNNADGYTTDAHGNFIHSSTTASNYFNLNSNDKSKQLKYYWETGNLEVPGTIKTNSKSVAYLTATPTTGQVVVTDGTKGGVKTTGYTIATSVPSGAIFTDTNTHRPINVNGTQTLGNNTTALNLKSGTNVTLTASGGDVTISSGKWTSASTGAVGDTTITISDSSITANSVIDVYTSNTSGSYIALKTLTSTTGSATITFNALTESTQFKLLIR